MDFRLEGTRRIVNLLTFMLRSLKAERCDFGGKIAPALEPFENKDSSLVLLLEDVSINNEYEYENNFKPYSYSKSFSQLSMLATTQSASL